MSTEKKVIAVMGATGAQGGGLIRAILADDSGQFAARAITRDVNSKAAQALAKQGVEVVAADIYDPKSLEKAFSGAYGAFLVTFFWAHMTGERELAEARNLAQASKAAGVKHAIWSTLEDMRQWVPPSDPRMPTLQGKYTVPHFDAKGEANGFFTELGVPTTFLNTSFYWENFIYFGAGPQKQADGTYAITMPMGNAQLPGVASEDIGKAALAIFKKPELIGKTLWLAGDKLTIAEYAQKMSKALGKEIRYNDVPADVFRHFDFPGAEEMGNMYQVKRDFAEQYCAPRDLQAARALVPSLQSFDAWLAKNAKNIPL